ncbi:MAG TPA: BON domain-containing protein [Candidatus Acidoferrales bacterium]|nr:BON domain-containing protein [Candidatus Acidoferrales bacterium]
MTLRAMGQFVLAAAFFASAAVASHKTVPTGPVTDADIAKAVRHEVLMYPRYTLWDDIDFRVNNGSVELMGAVTQPFKKDDLGRLVKGIPGVETVANNIKVLPLSPQDDRLRLQVARAIFRDPSLSRYAMGAIPSIHIIVDNGHVTLTGEVMNAMDKQIAGMRASSAGLSFGPVRNNLQVENVAGKKSS